MTLISISKRVGVATAALQIAARRIIGHSLDRDPAISITVAKDDYWIIENHSQLPAFDLQIQPITFLGMNAQFPPVPIVSSIHSARLLPTLSGDGSIGPLSRQKHNIREILSRQWSEANRLSDIPVPEQVCPVSFRYQNRDGWHFTVAADLVLRVGSGELSVRSIRNVNYPEDREN